MNPDDSDSFTYTSDLSDPILAGARVCLYMASDGSWHVDVDCEADSNKKGCVCEKGPLSGVYIFPI